MNKANKDCTVPFEYIHSGVISSCVGEHASENDSDPDLESFPQRSQKTNTLFVASHGQSTSLAVAFKCKELNEQPTKANSQHTRIKQKLHGLRWPRYFGPLLQAHQRLNGWGQIEGLND